MRKWMAMVLLALFLCGCANASDEQQTESTKEPTQVTETIQTEMPETIPPLIDNADFEIVRQDNSWVNEYDEVLVEQYYDQVILAEEFEGINTVIARDAASFVERLPEEDFAWILEDPWLSPENPYFSTANSEVTNNSGGIFSVKISTNWYMGGVSNFDYYGMTFDLRNDRAVTLEELFDTDEAVLNATLKNTAWAYLTANCADELFDEAYDTLYGYQLADFLFYIQDGELILTFPTYTFGPGAFGATIVPTGMYIAEK